jgi:hypothetical protein
VVASYSSKGPTLFDHLIKPDLVAPGNKIVGWRRRVLRWFVSIPSCWCRPRTAAA